MNIAYKISKKLDRANPKIIVKQKFNKSSKLTLNHIDNLIDELNNVIKFWEEEFDTINACVVEFDFNEIISKSKRLKYIIKPIGANDNNIVGVKFLNQNNHLVHAYVYKFDSINDLIGVINIFNIIRDLLIKFGDIDYNNYYLLNKCKLEGFTDTARIGLVLELIRIKTITVPNCENDINKIDDKNVVHFYGNPEKIFKSLNIKLISNDILSSHTYTLSKEEFIRIKNVAPYFLSNGANYYFNQPKDEIDEQDDEMIDLGLPNDQPIIGVIDIGVVKNDYHNQWVEVVDKRNEFEREIGDSLDDGFHGTIIDSLIIHGNELNRMNGLEDNCGRFRVKHFCVANKFGTDVYQIMERIKEIVEENHKTIKVYNLSMGTESQISQNFISPVSYLIDNLQAKYDVIFVVAGTNNNKYNYDDNYYIGSAADSINSIVVNSVKFGSNERTSYARKGPSLHLLIKPDVSYYGGDEEKKIIAFNGIKKVFVSGTSMAAPFITRKVAFLIYKLGLSKEVAKALILDSASGWDKYKNPLWIGRGIVPVKIEDVVYCQDDEIRFLYTGKVEGFESFNYSFPFYANKKDKFPFAVRTLMTYFPHCSIDKGVDYANVEIDFRMGQIKNGKIKPISNNYQYERNIYINEEEARKEFAKWDNVKRHIPVPESNHRGKTKYDSNKWGFAFKTIFRNGEETNINKYNIKFGVVITLKNTDKENVSTDFIKLVQASDWSIQPVDISIYNKLELLLNTEIKFE